MGHSSQTPNYDLPIFVREDSPSWMGDWNNTMTHLDTAIAGIDAAATAAKNSADSTIETVSTINTDFASLKTEVEGYSDQINAAVTTSATALSTANDAKTTATTASNNATSALTISQSMEAQVTAANQAAQEAKTTADNASAALNNLISIDNNPVAVVMGTNSSATYQLIMQNLIATSNQLNGWITIKPVSNNANNPVTISVNNILFTLPNMWNGVFIGESGGGGSYGEYVSGKIENGTATINYAYSHNGGNNQQSISVPVNFYLTITIIAISNN